MKRLCQFPVILGLCVFIGLSMLCLSPLALAEGPSSLQEGIDQYKQENYEEAADILKKVRQQDPKSAMAAFFLGLSYKQMGDNEGARQQFEEAVTLDPPVRDAVIELIDTLYRMGKYEQAFKWIALAEKEGLAPAKIAFLKGLVLSKTEKYTEAIAAFEKSKELDGAYRQSADMQIGLCYMNKRDYRKASERFQTAVTQDPLSDLASYARRYQDISEQRRFTERPLRLSLGVMGQYDTNMLTLPQENQAAPATFNDYVSKADKKSWAMLNTVRLDYVPVLPGRLLFNAGYAAMNSLHEKYSTTYDTLANSFSMAPGLSFGSFALNLVGSYTHILKRDGSYRRYSEIISAGPLFRYILTQNQMLDVSGSFSKKNFFRPAINTQYEDMSSDGFTGALSWMMTFLNGGLINVRYEYNSDNADGIHYDNQGHRITANLIYPLWKSLSLQISGDTYLQNYNHENVFFGNEKRKDWINSGTAGLTWDVNRYLSLIAQFTQTRAYSNIYAYDYDRSIVSAGMELKF